MGEKVLLSALAPDTEIAYQNAVNSLGTQPQNNPAPEDGFWLTNTDLDVTQAANDTYAKRLANAANKALNYLAKTSMSNAVVELCSAQLGLTEALTRRLLTQYAVLPSGTLLSHLTGTFADRMDVVDYATLTLTFDGWFWASRAAAICKKWKITAEELDKLTGLAKAPNLAKLLHFVTLPLNSGGAIASLDQYLRTSRLIKLRDSLPEDKITLLEVLEKLNNGAYPAALEVSAKGLPLNFRFPEEITGTVARNHNIPIQHITLPTKQIFRFTGLMTNAQRTTLLNNESLIAVTGNANYQKAIEQLFQSPFAVDVERLNENWRADDVEALITSLDLTYPADYLLAESWERLSWAFAFLDNLNASASTVEQFAAAAMTFDHEKILKELLRSKFGAETWLALSTEIQDVLRERKRDALVAYLLTLKKPDEAPSDKWENTNDLYAYYLLDVEMSSCQLTSRLVQGSGSIQLFVQRCFMGLERKVVVQADGANGDSAWRWWEWMRKYRVWGANREVYLRTEIFIEPELKKDRSPFFKDMENELMQNEINQFTAETAFANYLEKLDGVAQLEIAGFYQEDDGDNTILHVFGRTAGAEPHLYYYRRYDYYQWSPWEKVDLDIQGDYLIPAVVNNRLYLFWPVFTEVPDEAENSRMTVPTPSQKRFTPDKTTKKLRLQMAVSDYRQGKWTPKKVSTDFDESASYSIEIVKQHYRFFFIDHSNVDERIGIQYEGYSVGSKATAVKTWLDLVNTADETRIYRDTIALPANDDADRVLKAAKAAVVSVQNAVELAKQIIPKAFHILATSENTLLNANHVEAVFYFYEQGAGSPPWIESGTQDSAENARLDVEKADGPDADAAIDAKSFVAALERLHVALRAVRASLPANSGKDVVIPLARRALEAANTAVDAGTDALRSARAFRSTAATDFKSAAKEYEKAIDVADEAAKARDAFTFDYTEKAHLDGVFEISGCTGVPERKAGFLRGLPSAIVPESASVGTNTTFLKWVELGGEQNGIVPSTRLDGDDDFTLIKSRPPTSLDPLEDPILPTRILEQTPGIFKISSAWHLSYFDTLWSDGNVGVLLPFFYNDKRRTFFVTPSILSFYVDELSSVFGNVLCDYPDIKKAVRRLEFLSLLQSDTAKQTLLNKLMTYQWFQFKNFYHPFVCDFTRLVNNPLKGIPALMSRETQLMNSGFSFGEIYYPSESALAPLTEAYYPTEQVDFTPDGACSQDNWELFFHGPLLIANSLSKNQRFEEAREWYHFIFNPLGGLDPI